MRLEENTKTFFLKEEHIKLVRAMYVDFTQHEHYVGAPSVDVKRPYGNKDIYSDMLEILCLEKELNKLGDIDITEERKKELNKLHQETAIALQIILSTGNFSTGLYEQTPHLHREWSKVENLY